MNVVDRYPATRRSEAHTCTFLWAQPGGREGLADLGEQTRTGLGVIREQHALEE